MESNITSMIVKKFVNTVKTLPCGGHMAPISLTASQIADWCNGEVLQQATGQGFPI